MRRFVLLLAPCAVWALNNGVTITDLGTGQTARPFSISRVFACGEFPAGTYPQPHVLGGAAITPYQVDVMTTCADGSVRHAIISFAATIAASGSLTVDFVQSGARTSAWTQPSRSADQAALLAFNGGAWGGKIQAAAAGAAGKITASASARTALAAGYWRYWLNGPVARQIIIEDRYNADGSASGTFTYDFGFQCDSSTGGTCPPALTGTPPTYAATVWKAAADAAHQTLHPIFVATFYTGWAGVKTEFILESPWFGKEQDQQFDLALFNGGLESNPVYSRPATVFSAFRRMRETFWDGTAPNGWVNTDGNAGRIGVAVNYNLNYMEYSRAVPFYDPYVPTVPDNPVIGYETSEAAASYTAGDQTQWCGSGTANNGQQCGNFNTNMGTGGAVSSMAALPRPHVRYLGSFSALAYQNMIDNGQAAGSLPIALRESTTGKPFVAGGTADAFGRLISIDARPQFITFGGNYTQTAAANQMVGGQGTLSDGTIACQGGWMPAISSCFSNLWASAANASIQWQPWVMDMSHFALFSYVPYLITGDWYFLEELQYEAMWSLGSGAVGEYLGVTQAGTGTPNDCYLGHRAATADPATGMPDADFGYEPACESTRATAWAFAHVAHAWFASPDQSPEKAYFAEKLDRYLGTLEGALEIQNGNYFSAPNPGNAADPCNAAGYTLLKSTPWCFGRYTLFGNKANALGMLTWMGSYTLEGLDASKLNRADSPWWFAYYATSIFRAEELGYAKARPVRQALGRAIVTQVMDSSVTGPDGKWIGPVPYGDYRRVVQDAAGNSPASWLQVFQAIYSQTTLAAPMAAADGSFTINAWTSSSVCATTSQTNMYIDGGQFLKIDAGTPSEEIVLTGCAATCGAISTVNINLLGCAGQRGALGTAAQAHAAGAVVERLFYWPSSPMTSSKESGQYNQATGAASLAYDITVADSITGMPHTGLRAFEVLRGAQRYMDWNSSTSCAGVPSADCMNLMWDLVPPHTIGNPRVAAGPTSAQISFTAPDTNACKVGVSSTPFGSSDDSGDAVVAAGPASRSYRASGLTTGASYYYRITCGPGGGTARAWGMFSTSN